MTNRNVSKNSDLAAEITLWLLDETNLQARILSSLISNRFTLECKVSSLTSAEKVISSENHRHLILINSQNYTVDEVVGLLSNLKHLDEWVSIALFNVSPEEAFEELIAWPQVMGLFYLESDQDQLLKGIEVVLNRGHWLPRHLISRLLKTHRRAPKTGNQQSKITPREMQILQQLGGGLTNQEIGELIHVSEHTVRSHLYNVYKKIGVRNRTQACAWVKQNL